MIRRYLLTTVSFIALAGVASAADIPVRVTKAPPSLPLPIWTGPYVGVDGGAVWYKVKDSFEFPPLTAPPPITSRDSGWTLGVHAGYNWQFSNVLFGVETDFSWIDAGVNSGQIFFASPVFVAAHDLRWLATFRGRAGIVLDRTLFYLTGGPTVGAVKSSWIDVNGFLPPATETKTKWGWAAGGGIEHQFATAPTWSARAEVLYVDLGNSQLTSPDGGATFGTLYTNKFSNTAVIGRLGLSLKW